MHDSLHHLRVTLLGVTPKVTRGLIVPSHLSLDRLHQVLQIAMGWEEAHQHEYIVGTLRDGERYGSPGPASSFGFVDRAPKPEKRFTLQQIAPTKADRFLYWYDFGDDWHHEIVVKDIVAPAPDGVVLHCIEGQGACPPEDCGGPPGYANLLDALSDPKREDHEDMLEWVGGGFDPVRFDIDDVNEELARLARRWSRPARKRAARRNM